MITSTALTNWERMVASAAPITPMCRQTTKTMSRIILVKQLAIRKYSGRFESPIARRIPAPIL